MKCLLIATIAAATLLTGCATPYTGDPVKDAIIERQNADRRAAWGEAGIGVVRLLTETPRQVTIVEQLGGVPNEQTNYKSTR